MAKNTDLFWLLAPSITKAASRQTYYTIRLLADRERVADAYRAYAYFRWVDDTLDSDTGRREERIAFVNRQKGMLDSRGCGRPRGGLCPQEEMLAGLLAGDHDCNSGLRLYLTNMMAVMVFDAERRGRVISHTELAAYTAWLACAVTEAVHYFIGRHSYAPRGEFRYLAVSAAHITHMLRDTCDDARAGYFNIPREALDAAHITPLDLHSDGYRSWVRSRAELARSYFEASRDYLGQVESLRCRLACLAYMARFAGVLDAIERDGYRLRAAYPERSGLGALAMAFMPAAALLFVPRRGRPLPNPVKAVRPTSRIP
jgi:phytoene/squalene synthetase